MINLTDLATLICGGQAIDDAASECEFSKILIHLRSVLKTTLTEIQWLSNEPPSRIALYGPFLARSLLEVAVTAIIGRMDPTRLLVVKRTQEHGNYDTRKSWNSAIRWQGDVLDEKVQDLWTPKRSYKDMTKALFGDYYVEIYWTPAFNRLSEQNFTGGSWLAEIKGQTITTFAATRRDSIGKLYSELSKGVHSEFVIPPGSMYDKLTVSNLVANVTKILSELGLLTNLLPHIAYALPKIDALEIFNEIENIEVMS